jgi:hypothetical protein
VNKNKQSIEWITPEGTINNYALSIINFLEKSGRLHDEQTDEQMIVYFFQNRFNQLLHILPHLNKGNEGNELIETNVPQRLIKHIKHKNVAKHTWNG